jgi:O-antigen ligase
VTIPRWIRSSYVSLLCAGALLCLSAAVQQYGNPTSWPGAAYRTFTAAPTIKQDDPSRLLTFSLTNRDLLWSVAWQEGTAHPFQGTGAGSFDEYWYRNRTVVLDSDSAHSLYLETFGETGTVGLLVLAIAFLIPVLVGIRARFSPVVPSLVGAVAAFLLHAGTDWDWLVPGLTLPAILCSVALLVSGGDGHSVLLAARRRYFLVGCAGAVAVIAALGLVGNQLLLDSYDAADGGDFGSAERDASRAARWQPWSFLPWMQIGNARWALGDVSGARRAYETAASKEPDRPEPWVALAETSSGRQQELAVRRAQQLNPIGPEIIMLCGIDDRACAGTAAP